MVGSYQLAGDDLDTAVRVACGVIVGADPSNADVYDPRPSQLVPKSGAWGMIVRQLPPIAGGLDEHVRVCRVFWLEHEANTDEAGFAPGGQYRVRTRTPWGTVALWPYEYAVQAPQVLTEMWAAGELLFHPMEISARNFSDVLFYARSRGIALADAAVMALGTFSGPVGWFEPRADLAAAAETLERHVHRWPMFPPRGTR